MNNDFGGNSYAPVGDVTPDNKTMALLANVLAIPCCFIGPLVIYLIKGRDSAFVAAHAIQVLAFWGTIFVFNITVFVVISILGALTGGILGCLLLPLNLLGFVAALIGIGYVILAAVRANDGKIYEFPVSSQFVKSMMPPAAAPAPPVPPAAPTE